MLKLKGGTQAGVTPGPMQLQYQKLKLSDAGRSGRSSRPTRVTNRWTSGSGRHSSYVLKLIMLLKSFWRRFIKWTQDTFRTGGYQAELLPLLERCTRELQHLDKYKTDIRYLRIWIQYVSHELLCKSNIHFTV